MKALFKSKIFLVGLLLRILLLPFFPSHYLTDLFIPFIDSAILNPMRNPWDLNPPSFFPYGSVQFLILYLPKWLAYHVVGNIALGSSPLSVALMKVTLLPFDFLLLFSLGKFAQPKAKDLLLFYWLNPIVIYVTYAYGQLDIVSMFFCFISLIFLIQKYVVTSAVAMACALLCKFHVATVIPIMLAYLLNREFNLSAARLIGIWVGTVALGCFLGFLPLFFAGRVGYATTASPEAFRVFSLNVDLADGTTLYVGILIVVAIVGRIVISRVLTEKGLIFGSGIALGSLLLVTNPFPGWYCWVAPFIALFFSLYANVPRVLYWLFCSFYLMYFVGMLSFENHLSPLVLGMGFTGVQTALLGILVAIWAIVLRDQARLQGSTKPYWIGIAGDSGSGKNTLSNILGDVFGYKDSVVIEGDDYHKWERGNTRWADYTHLHPRANHLMVMAEHTGALQRGLPIFHPRYDHKTGRFTQPREVKPSKTIIVQGLHTFYLKGTRNLYDLKIFLAPMESVRRAWKIKRDVIERGHGLDHVLQSISSRQEDSRAHILPQRSWADWVIDFLPEREITEEDVRSGNIPPLKVRHILWNDAPVGRIFQELKELPNIHVRFDPEFNGEDRIALIVSGSPSAEEIRNLSEAAFPNLKQITRASAPPRWRSGLEGITQLIAVALAGSKLSFQGLPE